jgi:hypothetical protein
MISQIQQGVTTISQAVGDSTERAKGEAAKSETVLQQLDEVRGEKTAILESACRNRWPPALRPGLCGG